IRDFHVTGVQTCALPISAAVGLGTLCAAVATPFVGRLIDRRGIRSVTLASISLFALATAAMALAPAAALGFLCMFAVVGLFSARSDERRVGKDGGSGRCG